MTTPDRPKSPLLNDEQLRALARKFRAEINAINAQEDAEFADWQRERRRWEVRGGSGFTSFYGDGGDWGGGDGGCGD